MQPVLAGRDWLAAHAVCRAYVGRATARPAFRKAHADPLAHFAAPPPFNA